MPSPGMLPIEVLEAIVDQARDHRPSLYHLSLSCRILLLRGRYHIFSHIVITSREKLESVPAFLQQRSWLPPLVRRITIRDYVYRHPHRLLDVVPVPLLTQLPNLRSIELEADWTYSGQRQSPSRAFIAHHPHTLSALRKLSTHICHLELYRVSFLDADDLVRLLYAFPSLRTLLCMAIGFKRRHTPRVSKILTRDRPFCLARMSVRKYRQTRKSAVLKYIPFMHRFSSTPAPKSRISSWR